MSPKDNDKLPGRCPISPMGMVVPTRNFEEKRDLIEMPLSGKRTSLTHYREISAIFVRTFALGCSLQSGFGILIENSLTIKANSEAGSGACQDLRLVGGEGGIRTHVPAFGRQDAFEAPPL